MISPLESQGLLVEQYERDSEAAVKMLLGDCRYEMEYENVIVPVIVNGVILPLHVLFIERCAMLYQIYDMHTPTTASE